jgi:rod shape-determining protein MreC
LIFFLLLLYFDRTDKDLAIKQKIVDPFEPFLRNVHNAVLEVKEMGWALWNFHRLKQKNERLQTRIADLETRLLGTRELKIENERLNRLLNFKSQLGFDVIPSRIIGQNFSNWYRSVIVDKGSVEGVLPDQAVLSPKGVVGRVVEAFRRSSKIILLTDRNCQVGSQVLRTRDIGVLQGQDEETCILNYLSRTSGIRKGDLVITSGFDGVYPKGIILGEVIKVHSEDFGLYKYAEVAPSADFNKLEEVLIIRSEHREAEES